MTELKSSPINTPSEHLKTGFKTLITSSLAKGHSIALWRMPEEDAFQLLIQENEKLHSLDNLQLQNAFALNTFQAKGHEAKGLVADSLYQVSSANHDYSLIVGKEQKVDKADTFSWHKGTLFPTTNTSKDEFCGNVSLAVEAMEEDLFQKVVLSKVRVLESAPDLMEHFIKLCDQYPNAFVNLHSTPEYGTWIGATPEILISKDKNEVFKTVALAGTQPHNGLSPKEAVWRQKEIEEQALVSRYIISCFKKIRLREFEEHGPRTVQAGNLFHLKTTYSVDMKEVDHPELPQQMLDLLHPTSAVCGTPLEASKAFILTNETHERGLFCGHIGPVNIEGETQQFVNIRCAQFQNGKLALYAGAGITVDSEPEKEWVETEEKFKTVLIEK